MGLLKKSNNNKFVLSVGDEGAILTYIQNGKMLKRLFATNPSSVDMLSLLASDINAPIFIFLDVVDQSFTQHTFPPVSAGNIKKMVDRTLAKDYNASDIKAAISLGKEKTGKKDWNYLFIALRYQAPLSDWIETIHNLENKFGGIFLLPIESLNLLHDLRKATADIAPNDSTWQILVTHNRVGGFRQVVFKDDNVLFTRIAQPIGGQTPDVIAGNIEQETLNTIEYIRRLGFDDSHGLDIYIIAAEDVTQTIDIRARMANPVIALSPHQVAERLKIPDAADIKDRFADVLIACHFAKSKKHLLRLNTQTTKQTSLFEFLSVSIKTLTTIAVIGAIGFAGYNTYNIFNYQDNIEAAQKNKIAAEKQLNIDKNNFQDFNQDVNLITEISKVYGQLNTDEVLALEKINSFSTLKNYNINTSRIEMNIEKNNNHTSFISTKISTALRANKAIKTDIAATLLDIFDEFNKDITELYKGYKVTFAQYPIDNLTYQSMSDEEAKNLEFKLDLKIEGPTIEEKAKNKRKKRTR